MYHTGELLDAIAAVDRGALGHLTVCALDRPGPDTSAAASQWKERYPEVVLVTLADLAVDSLGAFARDVARYVRPGGIVLQDIQLTTLPFVPADRWWESIYLGATIRGLFADRAPIVRFCSNKRGYDATFGKDLIDAGFDPREVMDKGALAEAVVPGVLRLWRAQFPRTARVSSAGASVDMPVHDADRLEVERACDLVLWRTATGATLGGRLFGASVALKAGAPEIETWRELVEARLANRDGIGVLELGQRLSEPGAGRAEQTNLAARHIHGLRARLNDDGAIVTANHRYRLDDPLAVAMV